MIPDFVVKMKILLISFMIGLLVGFLYSVIRVKSPAPLIVGLTGLLGMVLGEHAGGCLPTTKTPAASLGAFDKAVLACDGRL